MINSDVITVLIIVVLAFIALRWAERKIGHRIGEDAESLHYEQKIVNLENQIKDQRDEYEKQKAQDTQRILELERRIDFLVGELQRAGIRIRDLEQGATKKESHLPPKPDLPAKPLVLVVGSSPQMGEVDRQSLRRANIPFHRLLAATKADVIAFLRGQRQNGTLPPWMHVSAHAGPDGVELADGLTPPSWWNEHCQGMQVVFLAACKTAKVAEALAGLVTVIFIYEDIGDQDASAFTYAFWRRMHEHGDPLKAYRQAVIEAPQIAEFTDIRTG